MPKIFVSYSTQNRDAASKLAQDLEQIGINVFIDYVKLEGGSSFSDQLQQEIAAADYFLFLVSIDSIQSPWVKAEVGYAYHLRKKIIPLMLDKTNIADTSLWYLLYIQNIQFMNWENEEAYRLAFSKLQTAITPFREKNILITPENAYKVKNTKTLTGHTGTVRCVRFSPDSQIMASCAEDNNLILWRDYQPYQMLQGHNQAILSLAFSPDGKYLASVSSDLQILVWGTDDFQIIHRLAGHNKDIRYVQFSHDSQLMATASYDSSIILWDTMSWKMLHRLEGHSDYVRSVAFSNDNRFLASASKDKSIRIWETKTGQNTQILKQHSEAVHSVDYSPEGKYLVSGSYDKTILVWNSSNWNSEARFKTPAWIRFVRFSPKGNLVASAGNDNTIRLWNLTNWEEVSKPLVGHYNSVLAVDFSPNGDLIASAGGDSNVRIWGLEE